VFSKSDYQSKPRMYSHLSRDSTYVHYGDDFYLRKIRVTQDLPERINSLSGGASVQGLDRILLMGVSLMYGTLDDNIRMN
jgi:hypothetical protein